MMNCSICGDEHPRDELYGPLDEPLCWTCYSAFMAEDELNARDDAQREGPTECPACHEKSLYSKEMAGYPGLYHCANCRAWIDTISNEAWRYENNDPASEPRS